MIEEIESLLPKIQMELVLYRKRFGDCRVTAGSSVFRNKSPRIAESERKRGGERRAIQVVVDVLLRASGSSARNTRPVRTCVSVERTGLVWVRDDRYRRAARVCRDSAHVPTTRDGVQHALVIQEGTPGAERQLILETRHQAMRYIKTEYDLSRSRRL